MQIAYNNLKVLENLSITKTSNLSRQFSEIVILTVGLNVIVKPEMRAIL